VDLHHNNHVHPSGFVADGPTAEFEAENHDDGTGTHYRIHFTVTDLGGKVDSARVEIWPEVDLEPSAIAVFPENPGTTGPMQCVFKLHNRGRMPAPISRWRLVADGLTLAEGDTLVAAEDSVLVSVVVPPQLTAGVHTLRVVADTLTTVPEPDETNNATARPITVLTGSGTTDAPGPPLRFALSSGYPNPTSRAVAFALELPRAMHVAFAVLDVQGREVWSAPAREMAAGRTTLAWNGERAGGGVAPTGIYLARVRAGESVLVRRFAVMR
jgi:hypothetical protein